MWLDQPSRSEHVEMEREGRPGKTQLSGDLSRRETQRGVADEQPENVQARLLGERGKRIDSLGYIHISRTMEIYVSGPGLSRGFQADAGGPSRQADAGARPHGPRGRAERVLAATSGCAHYPFTWNSSKRTITWPPAVGCPKLNCGWK